MLLIVSAALNAIPEPSSTIVAVPDVATLATLVAVSVKVSLGSAIASFVIATRTNKVPSLESLAKLFAVYARQTGGAADQSKNSKPAVKSAVVAPLPGVN